MRWYCLPENDSYKRNWILIRGIVNSLLTLINNNLFLHLFIIIECLHVPGLSREIEEQPLENIYLYRTYILEGSQKKTYYISKVQTIFVISAMEINKLKRMIRSSGVKEEY